MDASTPATKPCPSCGEAILARASKCRFCGGWLDEEQGKALRAARMTQERAPVGAAGRLAAALTMVAIVPLGVCSMSHSCMCGHLAHGPDPTASLVDGAWSLSLLGATVLWLFFTTTRRPVRGLVAGGVAITAVSPLALDVVGLVLVLILAGLGLVDVLRSFRDGRAAVAASMKTPAT